MRLLNYSQAILVSVVITLIFNLTALAGGIIAILLCCCVYFFVDIKVSTVEEVEDFSESDFDEVFNVCSNLSLPAISILSPNTIKSSPAGHLSKTAQDIVAFYELHKMKVKYITAETGVKLDMYIFRDEGKITTKGDLVPMSTANIVSPKSELARKFGVATEDITFMPTIPGRAESFGIILPSKYNESAKIQLRNVFEDTGFKAAINKSQKQFSDICLLNAVPIVLGSGTNHLVYHEMNKNPHLLIAGATGSGKSVCLSTILTSLMMLHSPDSLHLYLSDLKGGIELNVFEEAKHVKRFCDTRQDTVDMLIHLEDEMARRNSLIKDAGKKSIVDYNESLRVSGKFLPFIVVVIDEFISLVGSEDSMDSLVQLTAKARSAGIFIILSLQRPDADTVPGLIKANMNCRISFKVTSGTESRIILDSTVAGEDCRGEGDGYVKANGKITRFQGCYVEPKELKKVIKHWS